MTSSRPYLIRAIHEWITDNGLTPYILVDASAPGLKAPEKYIENGKIILNLSHSAVHGLQIENDWIMFGARFDGQKMEVHVPTNAVLAIYARENGRGMVLENGDTDTPPPTDTPPKGVKKPHLQVVK